jgi:hypothetical protein
MNQCMGFYVRPIHDRMPVILAPEDWDVWFETDAKDMLNPHKLLKPYPSEGMAARPVSTNVNNPRNDSPECLALIKLNITANRSFGYATRFELVMYCVLDSGDL